MPDSTPLVRTFTASVAANIAAVDLTTTVCEAPFAGTVTAVSYTPKANITGADTETRTFTLVNKGADGNGTTVIATRAMVNAVNSTDYNEDALTLSVVANATTVAAGDILAWVSTHSGSTGLADPGGLVSVDITRA